MANSAQNLSFTAAHSGRQATTSSPSSVATERPSTIAELLDVVRSTPRLLPVGALTKPRLSAIDGPKVSLTKLTGITEYEPSEYTFTALAGTAISDVAKALKERGQYLPFDSPFSAAGATLGGAVAAGLSGPRRFRFGGLRDFILGMKFIDGSGTLLRMGGKVVKNAAGFDLPKFFVGSLGRLGVLVEITFKVFPEPCDWLTLKLEAPDLDRAVRILIQAANSRWEPYALDYLPDRAEVLLELGGPGAALDSLANEILTQWRGARLSNEDATSAWSDLKEFRWTYDGGELIKVALTPKSLVPFCAAVRERLKEARLRVSAGGNVAFVSLKAGEQTEALDQVFLNVGLQGMTLCGSGPLWLGKRSFSNIDLAIKRALDPVGRFPSLQDQ